MCFTPSASFVAGASLSAIGVATTKKVKRKTTRPFASIPFFFGIQQITEGAVWLTLRSGNISLNTVFTFAYGLFAYVFWPIFIPFAIRSMERVLWRKKVLVFLQIIGGVVGSYLLYSHLINPVTSQAVNKSIVYTSTHFYSIAVLVGYFSTTILSFFFSSRRLINMFGILILSSAVAAYWVYATYFVSVWCFFSALLSGTILYIL